jgi:hypothetical protein
MHTNQCCRSKMLSMNFPLMTEPDDKREFTKK